MIQLELTPQDSDILASFLENAISDLSMEISHTDRLDFRNLLKHKREILNRLLAGVTENQMR